MGTLVLVLTLTFPALVRLTFQLVFTLRIGILSGNSSFVLHTLPAVCGFDTP